MSNNKCTEDMFLSDVKDHVMTVIRDDGVNRHIRFKEPGTIHFSFDLITWPGHLCVTGDCGSYLFQRLEDMFDFFRMDEDDFNRRADRKLNINPHYWMEKVLAEGRNDSCTEYSPERFKSVITEWFESHFEDCQDEEKKSKCWDEIETDVLPYADEHEAYARQAANDFRSECGFAFNDFWETDLQTYTFRYIWCLYSIVWGISKYDEAASLEKAA